MSDPEELREEGRYADHENLTDYIKDFAFRCSQRGIVLPKDLSDMDAIIESIFLAGALEGQKDD